MLSIINQLTEKFYIIENEMDEFSKGKDIGEEVQQY